MFPLHNKAQRHSLLGRVRPTRVIFDSLHCIQRDALLTARFFSERSGRLVCAVLLCENGNVSPASSRTLRSIYPLHLPKVKKFTTRQSWRNFRKGITDLQSVGYISYAFFLWLFYFFKFNFI